MNTTAHLAAAIAVSMHRCRTESGGPTSFAPAGWRLPPYDGANAAWTRRDVRSAPETPVRYRIDAATSMLHLIHDGAEHQVGLRDLGPASVRVSVGGVEVRCRLRVRARRTLTR